MLRDFLIEEIKLSGVDIQIDYLRCSDIFEFEKNNSKYSCRR